MQLEVWQEIKPGDRLESANGTFLVQSVRSRTGRPSAITLENASGTQFETGDYGVYEVAQLTQKLSRSKRLKMAFAAAVRLWQETGRR
jgi:hypothetical protein